MDIQTLIQQELSITSFACSSLTRLSGGTANFVYRGVLSTPLADGTSTVIVKHAEDYLASNEEFKLSAKRCLIEERALDAQQRGQCSSACNSGHGRDSKIIARTPKLYHTSHATNTLVMEDLPDAVDLKTFLRSPDLSQNISREQAFAIGRATGLWLSSFHARMSDPQMEDTAQAFSDNKTMRELKFSVNYDGLVNMVDRYPDLLGDCRAVFEEVRQFAAAELEENGIEDQDKREMRIGRTGPIHGDFWSGNILLPKSALTASNPITPLFITDFELAQCGPLALDIGQMLAELYMLKHFDNNDAGIWVIEGFMDGYKPLNNVMAFRALLHVGTHLVFWGSVVPGWGNEEQMKGVVKAGRDLVVKASAKDRSWFEGKVWSGLFRS